MDSLHEKYQNLKMDLAAMGSAAVAFSSGVDSTFLLKTAQNVLGDRVIAITANSVFFPDRELEEARKFCEREGIRQIILDMEVLSVEGVRANPENRCYFCKRAIFRNILAAAEEYRMASVVEGSNVDDTKDYRPGRQAVKELAVRSPLLDAGLTKAEIRILSEELGLPTWDKPSFACLASRIPYGDPLSEEKLKRVDLAEELLLNLGFRQFRVRVHGEIARIEVLPDEFGMLLREENRSRITAALRNLGFSYITLDLEGYRSGSMNKQ